MGILRARRRDRPAEVERCREKLNPVVEQFAKDMNPELVKAIYDSIDKVRAG